MDPTHVAPAPHTCMNAHGLSVPPIWTWKSWCEVAGYTSPTRGAGRGNSWIHPGLTESESESESESASASATLLTHDLHRDGSWFF